LAALISIYEPKECINLLLALLESWDVDNPKSGAYRIRPNQFQYRPLPIASCLYAIERTLANFDSKDMETAWLSNTLFPVLQRVIAIHLGNLKHSCNCTKGCF
jgi:hypothetical protein